MMRAEPEGDIVVTLQRSHACPVRVYDCRRFLTTLEKSSVVPRSSRGSFILPLEPRAEGSSSPAPSSAARLELIAPPPAGRPGMATAGEDEVIAPAPDTGLIGAAATEANPKCVPAWRSCGVEGRGTAEAKVGLLSSRGRRW